MVRETEELTVCGSNKESLRGAVEVVARALPGDLAVEVTFVVFLAALVGLVDGDGNKAGFQEFDDVRIGEGRRTVDDSVVSRTAQRMAVHRPDEERFLLLRRLLACLQQRDSPGNAPPRRLQVRPQFGMKLLKLLLRNPRPSAKQRTAEQSRRQRRNHGCPFSQSLHNIRSNRPRIYPPALLAANVSPRTSYDRRSTRERSCRTSKPTSCRCAVGVCAGKRDEPRRARRKRENEIVERKSERSTVSVHVNPRS
ncbi:MAG: hypothetical protein RIS70_316 [Planctomycetota bacterium]